MAATTKIFLGLGNAAFNVSIRTFNDSDTRALLAKLAFLPNVGLINTNGHDNTPSTADINGVRANVASRSLIVTNVFTGPVLTVGMSSCTRYPSGGSGRMTTPPYFTFLVIK